jgi:hypothetical protein
MPRLARTSASCEEKNEAHESQQKKSVLPRDSRFGVWLVIRNTAPLTGQYVASPGATTVAVPCAFASDRSFAERDPHDFEQPWNAGSTGSVGSSGPFCAFVFAFVFAFAGAGGSPPFSLHDEPNAAQASMAIEAAPEESNVRREIMTRV